MENIHLYSFEKLEVYQLAVKYSVALRSILVHFPQDERFGLTSQLRRSSDSISANLAEGSGRASSMDRAHFTNIAYSSALETISHINLAVQLGYMEQKRYEELRAELNEIINKLNALYKFQLKQGRNLKQIV